MKIYYDQDADLQELKGKKVAIVGYGIQGRGQALLPLDLFLVAAQGGPHRRVPVGKAGSVAAPHDPGSPDRVVGSHIGHDSIDVVELVVVLSSPGWTRFPLSSYIQISFCRLIISCFRFVGVMIGQWFCLAVY